MTLYDYKKKYRVTFPFLKKGDVSRCFKITLNIFGYFIISLFGFIIFLIIIGIIGKYIVPILNLLLENFDFIVKVLEFVL